MWISGFCRKIGRCSVFHAELYAILDGLSIAWDRGAKQLEVNTDNSEVVRLLNSPGQLHDSTIMRRIRFLLQLQWKIEINTRKENSVADALAHFGHTQDLGLMILAHPPNGIQCLLSEDMALAR
ncbi:hypothetical protein F3Y22_tig00112491pilonHSYRG00366 [Hibiscus syriacus]|uniref:RNase H type-1 domain-containing protein n=1 Tax=Hibiscus syriacus TaxID=106335 RepID=A0A6A2WYG3_HIBSY|nr:hypothetical protein F3Y22_tig00112491pilonHSYRG00366 [Hibiscus syriacus]